MRHAIPIDELGAQVEPMAAAIESCVHCGFCLPTCPTYATLGEEMDSPRGRIFLTKEVLEGKLELEEALPYMDNCLGCQACETACPSGVQYGALISTFRAYSEPRRRRDPASRLQRLLVRSLLPYPRRFRVAARAGSVGRSLGRLPFVPDDLAAMVELLPERLPAPRPLPAVYPAEGDRRARVALLAGCVQQVLDPEIGWATLRVLARNGIETVVPAAQGCCGALAIHSGETNAARSLARRNLRAFPDDLDAVITNAAGCGSGMHEYGLLFGGEPEQSAAEALSARVCDVSSFLHELGPVAPPPVQDGLRIAYHDACHLAHAQGVRDAPRALLAAIPGVEVVTPLEWELCCGSAGTYNLEKPAVARQLGQRKARNLLDTTPQLIATGNIGCITQIATHLRALGQELPLLHTVQVLDRAYAGTLAA